MDHALLTVEDSDLWLNSLYIRLIAPRNQSFLELVYVKGNGAISKGVSATLFMTNVTMQGNGDDVVDCLDCGLTANLNSGVYAEGAVAFFDSLEASGCFFECEKRSLRQWLEGLVIVPASDLRAVGSGVQQSS